MVLPFEENTSCQMAARFQQEERVIVCVFLLHIEFLGTEGDTVGSSHNFTCFEG